MNATLVRGEGCMYVHTHTRLLAQSRADVEAQQQRHQRRDEFLRRNAFG